MKILVVSDLPAFVTGGAETQAARLIEAWLDAGHEVICLGRRMGASSAVLGSHSIPVRRIRSTSALGRWGRGVSYFVSLALLLLRYRRWADIVYTRFLGEAAVTASVLKAVKLLRVPLVATPASSSEGGDIQFIMSAPFSKPVIRLLDRQCNAINLIAPSMDAELRNAGFRGLNFTRIPNGVLVGDLTRGEAASPLRMISVGRLTRQKGIDVLLRSLTRVKLPQGALLWIIGDGPDLPSLRMLSDELGLSAIVKWLGQLRPDDVSCRLQDSHVFILPSRYEGLSNAGLEAMERGLPLIITECGGLDSYVSADMGWVVPVEDEAALARAIDDAMAVGHEALSSMGHAARSCVRRHFDIRTVSQQYLDLFETLQDGPSAKSTIH